MRNTINYKMKQKSIIECQKPKLFLDTHKPKLLEDLHKIEKLLNPKAFPKYQEKIKFDNANNVNVILVNDDNRRDFRKNPLKFINEIFRNDGWLLFIYSNKNKIPSKIKENLNLFNNFKEHPYIFGKIKIKENSYNFENELDSIFGLLVRKEVYRCVGGISLKFFDFDLALYDLARKLSNLFFMIDLSKCGFKVESTIYKKDVDLEFERDFYVSLERDPFQAVFYDKYIFGK